MKIHSLLQDPSAVLVARFPLPPSVSWDDYRCAAFQTLSAIQFQLEGEKVILKPNVTSGEHFADPDTGITTHPGFVHGMLDYFQSQNTPSRRVTIVEDPRDSDDNRPRHWRGSGYDRLSAHTGVRLHCPTTYTCVKKKVFHPLIFPQLNVSRLAVAPKTVLINIPKFKTHNLSITSLCLKNLMGLVNVFDRHYCSQAWQELPQEISTNPRPRSEWFELEMHERWQLGLARRLADTAQVLQPTLNLVEGIVGREGTGFNRGRNHALGLVVAGINPVAVDSITSYIMGFNPLELIYLQVAAEVGLGVHNVHQLKVYILQEEGDWRSDDRGSDDWRSDDRGRPRLVLCSDVDSLRLAPPFRVISGIKGEDQDIFPIGKSKIGPYGDPTANTPVWSKGLFKKEN